MENMALELGFSTDVVSMLPKGYAAGSSSAHNVVCTRGITNACIVGDLAANVRMIC